uniref:MORN repeat-containing protein n=1 Tax=Candidatus Kentrum sp. FW TaxID=2126338 RepID=A0A450T171_9GAMM|nr:MAG: MORN repeat-containing protein [Candidatus Kentron sp. FW]
MSKIRVYTLLTARGIGITLILALLWGCSHIEKTDSLFGKPNSLIPIPFQFISKKGPVETYTVYPSGMSYRGRLLNGMRDGYGIQYRLDGTRYEGEWKEDRFHGVGRYYDKDGNFFEGLWSGGKYQHEIEPLRNEIKTKQLFDQSNPH